MSYGHGKVILLGEHAVVHGKPGLAVAVPNGAYAEAKRIAGSVTTLHIAPWNVDIDTGSAPNVGRERLQDALRVARSLYPADVELAITAHVSLPSGSGMGSSAALGVAVLRAIDKALGLTRSDQELFEASLRWERVFHGNPSGIDNAMAVHGGLALFKKGPPLSLERVVPRHKLRLVVGNSGVPGLTKEMVASVQRQLDNEPTRVQQALDGIEALVNNAKVALQLGDLSTLGKLMNLNQALLAGLMLSTEALEEMIAAARAAGALGAKLTGGGGGGCMIALVDSDERQTAVKNALIALGKTVYEVESGS